MNQGSRGSGAASRRPRWAVRPITGWAVPVLAAGALGGCILAEGRLPVDDSEHPAADGPPAAAAEPPETQDPGAQQTGGEENAGEGPAPGGAPPESGGDEMAGVVSQASGNDAETGSAEVEAGGAEREPAAPRAVRAYVKADAPQAGRRFGENLALRGNLLVVGAPNEDVAVAEGGVRPAGTAPGSTDLVAERGAAYVFRFADGAWSFEAALTPISTAREGRFAASVAIDPITLRIAVGVRTFGSPRVYLYEYTDGAWAQISDFREPQGRGAAGFGNTVAFYGDTLAVSAPDGDASEVFLYEVGPSGDVSGPMHVLTPTPEQVAGGFGRGSLALWGDRLVVGAGALQRGDRAGEGAAFLYKREDGEWSTTPVELAAPTGLPYDGVGWAVAASAEYVAVGAPGTDQNGKQDVGVVHIFQAGEGGYVGTAATPAGSEVGLLGEAVALDGTHLLAGAPGPRFSSGDYQGTQAYKNAYRSSGEAYLFDLAASFAPLATLTSPRPDARDRFGSAVGIGPLHLASGVANEDSAAAGIDGDAGDNSSENNGAVYIVPAAEPE